MIIPLSFRTVTTVIWHKWHVEVSSVVTTSSNFRLFDPSKGKAVQICINECRKRRNIRNAMSERKTSWEKVILFFLSVDKERFGRHYYHQVFRNNRMSMNALSASNR